MCSTRSLIFTDDMYRRVIFSFLSFLSWLTSSEEFLCWRERVLTRLCWWLHFLRLYLGLFLSNWFSSLLLLYWHDWGSLRFNLWGLLCTFGWCTLCRVGIIVVEPHSTIKLGSNLRALLFFEFLLWVECVLLSHNVFEVTFLILSSLQRRGKWHIFEQILSFFLLSFFLGLLLR